MKKFYALIIPLFLTSCDIYQAKFQCPPGKGIGCAPVGEVLDMIVELDSGEDLFIKDREKALLMRRRAEKKRSEKKGTLLARKLTLIRDDKGELIVVQEEGERDGNSR